VRGEANLRPARGDQSVYAGIAGGTRVHLRNSRTPKPISPERCSVIEVSPAITLSDDRAQSFLYSSSIVDGIPELPSGSLCGVRFCWKSGRNRKPASACEHHQTRQSPVFLDAGHTHLGTNPARPAFCPWTKGTSVPLIDIGNTGGGTTR